MVNTDTKITLGFVSLAVVLWIGTRAVTDVYAIQAAVLFGVGLFAPLGINEWRRRNAEGA